MRREGESVKRTGKKHLQAHNAVLLKLDFSELKTVMNKNNKKENKQKIEKREQ
jgi:hypothetical protein